MKSQRLAHTAKFLKSLYHDMLRIRLCEESFVEPILNGTIRCPVHLYSGEEAIAVGVTAALQDNDYVFGTHRSHGHYLAKGGNLKEMVAEIYCRESGCSGGRGGSMHLTDLDHGMLGSAPIVAGTIPLALGASLAAAVRKDKRVAVSFFGDGATGEGALYESMNFAALRKLPLIFVCENNLYSTHLPIAECRVMEDISKIASPFGISNAQVDGNDAVKVYEATSVAVVKCRRGDGPYFLEFLTYRMRGHVGPNDNIQGTQTDIRPKEEIENWRKRDPIAKIETQLLQAGVLSKLEIRKTREKIVQEIKQAHRLAQESPRPRKGHLKKYVFK